MANERAGGISEAGAAAYAAVVRAHTDDASGGPAELGCTRGASCTRRGGFPGQAQGMTMAFVVAMAFVVVVVHGCGHVTSPRDLGTPIFRSSQQAN